MRMTGKEKREKWEKEEGGQEGRKRNKERRGKESDRDHSGGMEIRAVQTG